MTRYAIYALPGALGDDDAPEALRLRDAAASWLRSPSYQDLTVSARRYGFHGTLKAPFRLIEGATERDLLDVADDFAMAHAPITIPALSLRPIRTFRALRPRGDSAQIDALAADAIRDFEPFRAPLTDDEIERRRPDRMSPAERDLFEQWGYPFVFAEFRFHMTLTDPVPDARGAEIDRALAEHFNGAVGIDIPLRSISVFVEPEPGAPFRILSTHRLADRPEAA